MKLIADMTTYFHGKTYSWAHNNWLSIHIASFLLLGVASLIMFSENQSQKRKRFADGVLIFLSILFFLIQLGNIYHWGWPDSFVAWQAGTLCLMAICYYMPKRIMKRPSKTFTAFFAVLFVLAGGIFTMDFILGEVIPVNVLINWE